MNKINKILELLYAIKKSKEISSKLKNRKSPKTKVLIEEYDLMVAGTQYLDKYGNSRYLNAEGSRKGTIFELFLEMDNEYDPLAIMVLHKGKHIGYIPRDENLEIAYYLSHPEQFIVECRQERKKDNSRYYEMIIVIIKVFAITENYQPFTFEIFDEEFPNYDEDVENLTKIRKENERKLQEIKKIEQEEKEKKEQEAMRGCLLYIVIGIIIFIIFKMCSSDKNNEDFPIYDVLSIDSVTTNEIDFNHKTDTLAILNQRQMDVKNEDNEIKNAYKILHSNYYFIETEVIRFRALHHKFRNTKYENRLRKTRDSLSKEFNNILEKAEKDMQKHLKNKK